MIACILLDMNNDSILRIGGDYRRIAYPIMGYTKQYTKGYTCTMIVYSIDTMYNQSTKVIQ